MAGRADPPGPLNPQEGRAALERHLQRESKMRSKQPLIVPSHWLDARPARYSRVAPWVFIDPLVS